MVSFLEKTPKSPRQSLSLFITDNLLYLLITKLPLDYARGQTMGTLIRAIVWIQDAQAPMAEGRGKLDQERILGYIESRS